jgi:hypothetical protein
MRTSPPRRADGPQVTMGAAVVFSASSGASLAPRLARLPKKRWRSCREAQAVAAQEAVGGAACSALLGPPLTGVEGNPYAPDIHHDPLEEARARGQAQASWWATQKVKFDDIFSSHHAPHLPQPGGEWEPTEEQLQVGRRFIADRHAVVPLSHHAASAISAAREERGEEQRRAMLRRLQALGANVDMNALRRPWRPCR